jgi:hypothetical protein
MPDDDGSGSDSSNAAAPTIDGTSDDNVKLYTFFSTSQI